MSAATRGARRWRDSATGLSATLVAELAPTTALRDDLAQASELALIAVVHALAAQNRHLRQKALVLRRRTTNALSPFAQTIR
ncbi:hypothetical protein [Bradyrhizobium sp. SZCCHNS2005]|uniref:hypothetical protein n=1 Tax=Bradyrhizobium sp. SZCCHNS2005 TaxID=3057303 RepID=UPI0028E1B12D|nr:hypothetical protein [Bradyrhizobium sp. SZCCHNS2005]